MALDTTQFSATGTVHMLARFTTGLRDRTNGQRNRWASDDWEDPAGTDDPTGTLDQGSVGITGILNNAPTLRRIAIHDVAGDTGDQVILNSTESTEDLGNIFTQANTPYRATFIHERGDGGTITMETVGAAAAGGSQWVRWERDPNGDLWTLMAGIITGDDLILAIHQGVASYSPADADIAFSAQAGEPTVAFAFEGQAIVNRDIAFAAEAGEPTAAFAFDGQQIVNRDIAFAAQAGDPSVAFVFEGQSIVERDMSFAAQAGDPTVVFGFARQFIPPPAIEYKASATTDLLISQWQNAATLKAVVQILLDVIQEELIDPMNRLQMMKRIDSGEGIWLDYIGERLGMIRPWIALTTDLRFGFDDAGVGFDQGRFADAIGALEPRTPIGDVLFRRLLKARVITIRSRGGIADYLRSIQEIDSGASIVDNHDMTITITTTQQGNLEIAERVEAIAKPAGVGRTFA